MDTKSIFKSKTVWAALIYAALISFDGPIQKFIQENQNTTGYIVCFIFLVLRFLTKNGVRFL